MKTTLRRILLLAIGCSFIFQTTFAMALTYGPLLSNQENSPTQRAKALQSLVGQFKHDVYVKKLNAEKSVADLTEAMVENQFTIADLQLYVQLNATPQEVKKFDQLIAMTLEDATDMKELTSSQLAFILKNAMNATSEVGANFMSCSVGLGVGIPLLAVGVIIGIIALVNSTASKEVVTKNYIQKRSATTTSYLNTKADLELEISKYKSDAIFYQDEIDELQRKINTGTYSAEQIEQMKLDIREYEFKISDANALIGEVQVDVNYYNSKYDADFNTLNQEELSERSRVDEKHKAAGKQAIVAGITTALGGAFVLSSIKDCN